MKFAIVPSVDEQFGDKYFKEDTDANDAGSYIVKGLKKGINSRGDEVHTIDMYDDWSQIDVCLIDWPRWKWIMKLMHKGLLSKTVYCNAEPTSVIPENCPEGYKRLKKIYPYILTWNREWVDNKSIFKKNIPYPFTIDWGDVPFSDKKLLTAITADKFSTTPGELYSERRNVYSFFETNYPDDFDFYGIRWKKEEHPGYKGTVDDKLKVYHNYKFAICLENTKGATDYVTEKIYDCLCAGIVPVYGGSSNILEYVPQECFIDYFKFETYEEMAEYLKSMDEDTYNGYLTAIKNWLETADHSEYTTERYVEYLYKAVENKKTFKHPLDIRLYIDYKGIWEIVRAILVDIKHKTIG